MPSLLFSRGKWPESSFLSSGGSVLRFYTAWWWLYRYLISFRGYSKGLIQLKKLACPPLFIISFYNLYVPSVADAWCSSQVIKYLPFYHSGEFLYLSWDFSQGHPFAFFLSVASLFQCWDVGVLDFFFWRVLGCPSHVLQRLLGLFRVHVVLPRPRAEVQVRCPLRAALLVAGEEAKPARTDGRQRSVSR